MSDEVNNRNILAVQEYAKTTRELFRELENDMDNLKTQNEILKSQVTLQQTQLQALQVKLFSGGATV